MSASVIKSLLDKIAQQVASQRHLPESTYRLQFHAGFTFRDATQIVPYLRELGITHIYASPLLKARPGSTHGYDITDHQSLNPELGTEEEFEALVAACRQHDLAFLLDVVPNHAGIGNDNQWWQDVLENGPASPYAGYFDIAWYSSLRPEMHEKVLVPILGEPYGQALEAQQLRLDYAAGSFTLHYFEHRFPITPRSYGLILSHRLEALQEMLAPEPEQLAEYESILTAIKNLPRRGETDPEKLTERQREKEVIKRRLATVVESAAPVQEFIQQNLAIFNGRAGDPRSFDLLEELLEAQAYRLSNWRVASDEINYRRFFDVNELAALSTEKREVFEATHSLILRLLREGKVMGLRIDHPDGLYDPHQYFERLQQYYLFEYGHKIFSSDPAFRDLNWEALAPAFLESCAAARERGDLMRRPLYLVVEKILGAQETLPQSWPVFGTSGYDFLNMINGLFVNSDHAEAFTRLYQDWIKDDLKFAEVVYQKKILILQASLASELNMLAQQLDRLAQKNRRSRDFTLNSLRHALREIIACFPVYRSYITGAGISEHDRLHVKRAIGRAQRKNPTRSVLLFEFIRDMLLLNYPESANAEDREEQRGFVGKFQQVTAPVMAKGLEDTAFYVYNRLISLNEVGGDPGRFGVAPEELHRYHQNRQAKWPWALSCTSTHDTKRSEDVRARLNALSEMPDEWQECLSRWSRMNAPYRQQLEETIAPDANDEYMLYQNLLGAWPLQTEPSEAEIAEAEPVEARMQAYMAKAVHEAKTHTSWINPYPAYDQAVQNFVRSILDEKNNAAFLQDFRAFAQRLSHYGMLNSLSQTLLKLTSPGAADIYQGNELWDFSLVDPDNRRPVNYEQRRRWLHELREKSAGRNLSAFAAELLQHKEDGRIKLYVTYKVLHYRRQHPALFAAGEYIPVEAAGPRDGHVFSFIRCHEKNHALVAAPRLLTRLAPNVESLPLGKKIWKDTRLILPNLEAPRRWQNLFTGERLQLAAEDGGKFSLALAEVFASFPVALLVTENSL